LESGAFFVIFEKKNIFLMAKMHQIPIKIPFSKLNKKKQVRGSRSHGAPRDPPPA